MSYRLDHSGLDFLPLASGELFCIVPDGHELAGRKQISAAEIVRYPLIGIDPTDPYGRIMAEIFARKKLNYDMTIRARFGTTVCALVKAGLGIAVIDQFTVAHGGFPGITLLSIVESTKFDTYIAVKRGAPLSLYVDCYGTGEVAEARLEKLLGEVMDLSPRGIREHLSLSRPIYARTSAYGHFGRAPEPDGGFSWERTDLVDELRRATN